MKSRTRAAAIATTAILSGAAFTGCAAFSDEAASSDDGVTRVTAGLYPLTWIAERVGGDAIEVTDLTPRGTDPHDLELTAKQTGDVADADLVILEKGMQAPLDQAAEQSATGQVLDVTDAARLVTADHQDESEEEHAEHADEHAEHADEHSEEEEHAEEGHEGHDHGSLGDLDPHFWQDPLRMADVADAVAEELAEVDPDNAETYRANAEDVVADLEKLDEEFTTGLATCERDTVVVSHNAFGYLTRYGLTFEPIAGLTPDAEPTPSDRARLEELIRTEGITTVFTERLASSKIAGSLATDAGVETAVLDPLEGLTDETADEDYLSLMRANLSALQQANGCQ